MIIALGHSARAGKDTAAQALVDTLGFTRVAFADPLRALVLAIDPIVAQAVGALGWEEAKTRLPFVRDRLIEVGNAARYALGADVWVTLSRPALREHKRVVVTDVRYPNELLALKALGALTIKIERPGFPPRDDPSDRALANWSDWDLVITNDGTIEDLRDHITAWVGMYLRTTA